MGRKPKQIVEPIKDGSFDDVADALVGRRRELDEFFEESRKRDRKKMKKNPATSEKPDKS